ncbi:probable carboxylesterase 18 [Oryza glaberrima]|uniref:Alpha/beta hydrolase fold-3 domain-containing protein n=1 Tax=Oryza glaberrima TaxID=4538 RepID=I1QCM7_ORYGL|nr:probable carboxylesterase 18 [Oryza glaberrima]
MAAAHGRRRRVALPWPMRLRLCVFEAAIDATQRRDGSVNRFLFSLFDRRAPADPRPDAAGVSSTDITVDASRGLWARVFYSPSPSPRPVVVYFHGGGFTLFSAASRAYDALCRTLCVAAAGAVVVSVDYRLAPEHRAPAAYDDGEAVLRYLGATGLPDHVGPVDVSTCFVVGDSAGGNIAHHVAQRWTATATTTTTTIDNPVVHLAGVILIQPCFSGEERTESERALDGVAPVLNARRSDLSWKAFLPVGADRNHPAAHVVTGDDDDAELNEAFPPAMVVVGGLDPLQDWDRRYAAMLRRKGKAARVVEFPEAIHAFYFFPEFLADDHRKLVGEIRAFVEECIASKQPTA